MTEEKQHFYPLVAGLRLAIAGDRPDLLLVELKTLEGEPSRFAMPKSVALKIGALINENANELTADRSAN
jgi:hypothetical protein